MEGIGKHLIFDGHFKEDSPLATVGGGHKFLTTFVAAIDMTIVVPPYILEFPVDPCTFSRIIEGLENENLTGSNLYKQLAQLDKIRKGKLKGISGLVVLAESHIAYHTFPEYKDGDLYFVSLDVYSCKEFETAVCTQFMTENGIVKGHLLDVNRFVGSPQVVRGVEFAV